MRFILIDPLLHTITNVHHPDDAETYAVLSDAVRGGIDCIHLGDDGPLHLDLWVNDECLMNIERLHSKQFPDGEITSGFFVLHNSVGPLNLVVGCAMLAASDDEGNTVGLPDHIVPQVMATFISFIPDSNRNAAADLAEELLDNGGCASSQAELDAFSARHDEIMTRAMELTNETSPCPNP